MTAKWVKVELYSGDAFVGAPHEMGKFVHFWIIQDGLMKTRSVPKQDIMNLNEVLQ